MHKTNSGTSRVTTKIIIWRKTLLSRRAAKTGLQKDKMDLDYLRQTKSPDQEMEIEKINDGRDTLMGQRLNMRGSVTQKETVSGEEEK